MGKRIGVMGAGFAGMAAATVLAQKGYTVTVFEKHATTGGRARTLHQQGFSFDRGPSWYWMPDVMEAYFARFGEKPSDYYTLKRLDPSYAVFFGPGETMTLPAGVEGLQALFASVEPGSDQQLMRFLTEAGYKYRLGMQSLSYKPSRSFLEYVNSCLWWRMTRVSMFRSMHAHLRSYFSDERLLRILEFPFFSWAACPRTHQPCIAS